MCPEIPGAESADHFICYDDVTYVYDDVTYAYDDVKSADHFNCAR
jgi:hypothetical protein